MKKINFFVFVVVCLNFNLSQGQYRLNSPVPCFDYGYKYTKEPEQVFVSGFKISPIAADSYFTITSKNEDTRLMISQNSVDALIMVSGKFMGELIGDGKTPVILTIGIGATNGNLTIYPYNREQYEQLTENVALAKPYPEKYDHVLSISKMMEGKTTSLNISIRNVDKRKFEIVDLKLLKN